MTTPSRSAGARSPSAEVVREYWAEARLLVVAAACFSILAAAASVLATYAFARLIDLFSEPFVPTSILFVGIAYVVLVGVSSGLQYAIVYIANIVREHFTFRLTTRYFERLLNKRVEVFIERNPAELLSALSRAQEAFGSLIQLALLVLFPSVARILLTIGLMYAVISVDIALIVSLYGAFFLVITYFANRRSRRYLDEAISAAQLNARFLGNVLGSVEGLRVLGSGDWLYDSFRRRAWEVYSRWREYAFYRLSYTALVTLALCAQFAVTFLILIPRFQSGHVSIGEVVLFNTLLLQLNQPFEVLGQAIDDAIRARATLRPHAEVMAMPELPKAPAAASPLPVEHKEILVEDVAYLHANGRGVTGISFRAVPGRITFLTGESGAGKSTVLRLLLKSLSPQAGRILVDGQDLSSITDAIWHSSIGIVPQDILLLNDTIEANIVLGRPHDEQALETAVRMAELDHLMTPDGLKANVGERGLKLSGGERQRIAIARALYASPSILLLDEASSALDDGTEAEIMSHLRRLASRITIVAVTHRLSVITADDAAYALREGKLVELTLRSGQ